MHFFQITPQKALYPWQCVVWVVQNVLWIHLWCTGALFSDITVLMASQIHYSLILLCAVYTIYRLYSNLLKGQSPEYRDKITASLKADLKFDIIKTQYCKKKNNSDDSWFKVMDVTWGLLSDVPERGCGESVYSANTLHLGRDMWRISISKAVASFAVMNEFPPVWEMPALCGLISWIHHG